MKQRKPGFEAGEEVTTMVRKEDGRRQWIVLKIENSRYDKDSQYWQYQLVDSTGKIYDSENWIKESDLKAAG
jgi:hypothetical protein